MIKPLADRVVIKVIDDVQQTSGGIFIPDSAKEKPQKGEVVAVGTGKTNDKGEKEPMEVQVGDVVLFANEKNTLRNFDALKSAQNIAIIVGSEGGFSDEEINQIKSKGATEFGLGSRILRAETACIAMSAIIGFFIDV